MLRGIHKASSNWLGKTVLSVIMGLLVVSFAVWALSMTVAGPLWALMVIIVLDAILGTALGLAASSTARTEFQAVQMMPAIILPQLLIAGLFIPRDQMPTVLHWISDVMPLSYSIDALNELAASANASGIGSQIAILCAFIIGALALGVATLRRRTG